MIRIYIIGIISLFATSCSDFLKEYSQDMAYVQSYKDLDELLLGGAYLNAEESHVSPEGYTPYIHMMADEMQECIKDGGYSNEYNSPRDKYFGYYTWQNRVDLGYDNLVKVSENNDWKRIYEHINVASMIIQGISEQKGKNELDHGEINRIRGEAYFLRGAYYFWLVNLYGKPYKAETAKSDPGVPLKLTEYIEDKKYTRNSVQEVYDQVIRDLDEAEKALEKAARKSVFRADITATYLLKSRLYLYMRDWEKAKFYAEKVLEKNNQLTDLNSFNEKGIFLNKELVELIFSTGNSWISYNTSFRLKGMGVSEDLMDSYKKDKNDLRFKVFLDTRYPPYSACKKYAVYGNSISDVCVYRTAEAYLNLAEARAYLNDEAGAREALNALRIRRIRIAGYKEVKSTGKELMEYIRDERFRELAFEGHRWYDLRRYTVCDRYPLQKVLKNTYTVFQYIDYEDKPWQTFVYKMSPNDPAYTLPIPKEVLEFDELIENNPRNERGVSETINHKLK